MLASILISTYRHFVFQVVSMFILAALTYPSYRIYKHTITYAPEITERLQSLTAAQPLAGQIRT